MTIETTETTAEYVARVGTVTAVLYWRRDAKKAAAQIKKIEGIAKLVESLLDQHNVDDDDVVEIGIGMYKAVWQEKLEFAVKQIEESLLQPWNENPPLPAMFPESNLPIETWVSIKREWDRVHRCIKTNHPPAPP